MAESYSEQRLRRRPARVVHLRAAAPREGFTFCGRPTVLLVGGPPPARVATPAEFSAELSGKCCKVCARMLRPESEG